MDSDSDIEEFLAISACFDPVQMLNVVNAFNTDSDSDEEDESFNPLPKKLRRYSPEMQAEIDAASIGVGVTSEAQSIFDALSKTLPVRWDKTVIVVMNEVRVSSPYLAESVTGGTAAANERVRKVLELERKRLQTVGGGQ